jgi:hypothetical protein
LTAGRTTSARLSDGEFMSSSAHTGQRFPERVSTTTIGESSSSERPMSVIDGAADSARSTVGVQRSSAEPGLKPSRLASSTTSIGVPPTFFGTLSVVNAIRRRVRVVGSSTV